VSVRLPRIDFRQEIINALAAVRLHTPTESGTVIVRKMREVTFHLLRFMVQLTNGSSMGNQENYHYISLHSCSAQVTPYCQGYSGFGESFPVIARAIAVLQTPCKRSSAVSAPVERPRLGGRIACLSAADLPDTSTLTMACVVSCAAHHCSLVTDLAIDNESL